MSWRVLLALVVCNAIWATNPLMGKKLLVHYPPLQVSWLRYSSAFAMALLLTALIRWRRPQLLTARRVILQSDSFRWVALTGLCTFFGSGVVQYIGLSLSTSTANSLLVALEPLFAVFLAWIFLRERVQPGQFLALALAVSGFLLLSNVKPLDAVGSFALFNIGNLLLLLSLPLEAMYTIISRKLAGRVQPVSLFASSLAVGLFALTLYVMAGPGLPDLSRLDAEGWLAVLFMGPLGTALTYIYWSVVLKEASVAAVSLTLFVQPILGAAFGIFLLGDRLDPWQLGGGLLILGALTLQTNLEISTGGKRAH